MSDELGEVRVHLAQHDREIALKTQLAAQGKLLQAVATTQGQHSRMLGKLETDVAVLKTDVAVLKTDVADLKAGMREVKTGIRVIVAKLDEALDK